MKSINLLLYKKKSNFVLLKYEKPIFYISVSLLSLFIIVSVFSIVAGIIFMNEINIKKTTERELRNSIQSSHVEEGLYLALFNKTSEVSKILSTNPKLEEKLNEIYKLTGVGGIKVSSLNVDRDLHTHITMVSDSAQSLDNFISAFEQEQNHLSNIRVSGISRDKTGLYTFSLDFSFKKS
ncbi:MAG: hypothetical protein UT63_C0049G0015 [Candidatus Gottesmanbacteria bacterium GW2011_GWC2_39_8]|uniref:Fimbrial assembly family protein n=1 Tax=Candidatus Gottesmanbacteria bacterium GW2011_GWC2_39_8 TaxID=1618450 RepID=A0A0G0Q4C7_9BACT|nr:MAG: hypothetical protein UT63_C0049G0015 [Candidatus Gottesmanbacteria bacterium GW2011_GWC2_39_8]